MALPKRNRLSLRTSKDLFLGGKKFYSIHFTITKSTIDDLPVRQAGLQSTKPSFAVVVSKKTARKAHDRHKIRRLTTSAIFDQLSKFSTGYYLVFPKNTVLTTSYSDILTDLLIIVSKLK